ncbi:hypothetical protein [Altericista sp. CCNU0014]
MERITQPKIIYTLHSNTIEHLTLAAEIERTAKIQGFWALGFRKTL